MAKPRDEANERRRHRRISNPREHLRISDDRRDANGRDFAVNTRWG